MPRQPVLQDYGNIQMPESDNTLTIENNRLLESRRQNDAQMRQQRGIAKAKEQGDALNYIGGLKTNPIGDTTIDDFDTKLMMDLQGELIGMYEKGASKSEIQLIAIPRLQKMAQGSQIAKNEYSKLTEGVKELSKDNPTGDMAAVRNIGGKELLKTIFDFDDKGNVKGYKDASLIPPGKNYLENLETNENLPKWYKESGEFEKGIKSLPLIPVGGSTSYTDRYGKKVKQSYTGHGSTFEEPIMNSDNEQTGWKLKGESVPLGRNPDGSLIIEQVMPKEQFDLAIQNEKAKKDFELKFNKELQESGVDPDQLDPRAKDVLQRKFAYDFFEKTGIHGSSFLTKDEIKEAPVRNVTNVRVNTGGEAAKINNIYGRIGGKIDADIAKGFGATRFSSLKDDEQAVVKKTVENAGYELEEGGANIYLAKDGDEYKVYKAEEGKLLPKNIDNEIATFSFVGTNLPKQADTKTKKAVVAEGNQARQGKLAAKTISAAKLKSLVGTAGYEGYTEKEIQDYYRKNGYEIK